MPRAPGIQPPGLGRPAEGRGDCAECRQRAGSQPRYGRRVASRRPSWCRPERRAAVTPRQRARASRFQRSPRPRPEDRPGSVVGPPYATRGSPAAGRAAWRGAQVAPRHGRARRRDRRASRRSGRAQPRRRRGSRMERVAMRRVRSGPPPYGRCRPTHRAGAGSTRQQAAPLAARPRSRPGVGAPVVYPDRRDALSQPPMDHDAGAFTTNQPRSGTPRVRMRRAEPASRPNPAPPARGGCRIDLIPR